MKITLVSLDYNGYDSYIVKELRKRGIETHHIDLMVLKIPYPNPVYKVVNFLTKTLFSWNFKNKFQKAAIEKELKKIGIQDKILVIRADLLTDDSLKVLKSYAQEFIAYHYDCADKFPRIVQVSEMFDKVYSFEKKDCEKYNYHFITNYIHEKIEPIRVPIKYNFFNVSSHDERTSIIEKIAEELNKNKINFYIRIVGKFSKTYSKIENIIYTKKYIKQEEVRKLQDESFAQLDVNRENQEGLSFRFFESLAKSKKIITTNSSVKEYDFYNPENILIINPDEIKIDTSFFETPYQPIDLVILKKYTIEHWVKQVFQLK